jgi:NAD(P)-dependent dehydrogenase (short-subunit alcohol dehydrogenase family)
MKTAVVTGGNAGLGLACARHIARDKGWRVVLACRDEARGREAAAAITAATGNSNVETRALDLASLASVRAFAAGGDAVDALVCNAGLQIITGRTTSADGFETTFAVNHLGHFLVANQLAPRLPDGGRIVFVSSNTHDPKRWTGLPPPRFGDPLALARDDDRDGESPGHAGRRRYTTSKLCNVLCAYEMHRRLGGRVAVNAFDPGLMPGTGLARDYGAAARFAYRFILPVMLLLPNINSVEKSGRRLARLAIDPIYDGISGKYFSRGRDTRSSLESYDEAKARALWDASLALAG